jgi:hypothetical protein
MPNDNNIHNAMVQSKEAVKDAMKTHIGLSGRSTDPHLEIYNTLKPEHFDKLVETYGADNVLEYIKKMEAKRLLGG